MKEKDPWMKKFRQRLDSYEEPVPTDLWEQLEKELQPSPRRIPYYRRWQVVAAVALLLIASTITIRFWQSPAVRSMQQLSAEWQNLPHREADGIAWIEVPDDSIPDKELDSSFLAAGSQQAVGPKWMASSTSLQQREELSNPNVSRLSSLSKGRVVGSENHRVNELPQDTSHGVVPRSTEEQPRESEAEVASSVMYRSQSPRRLDAGSQSMHTRLARSQQGKGWSIGISTGNGSFASSVHSSGYLPIPSGSRGVLLNHAYGVQVLSEIDKLVQFKNMSEGANVQSDVSYKMPIVFGASLRMELNTEWALETGLIYTQLASETRSGTIKNHYGWKDKLHYVGIPLQVHRRLWSHGCLDLYASVGGAVEKAVSGQRTMIGSISTVSGNDYEKVSGNQEKLEVKPLQWSVHAAFGAQIKLSEHWGIYAEPGMAYYFHDGSEVNTIRKEHPLQFNLQLGLRFSFLK